MMRERRRPEKEPLSCAGPIVLTAALLAAALILAPLPSFGTKIAPRASEGSCRQAANGLISLLDAKTDDTALYRDTYTVVVDTCGPPASNAQSKPGATPPGRVACRDLAAALVDLIEDGKMNIKAFVEARSCFAQVCPPR
jgi:hypothetical protein